MAHSYIAQIGELMDRLFEVLDQLDAHCVSEGNPVFGGDNGGLRELVKMDMLLFIIRIADNNEDDTISGECLEFINGCLDYNFTTLTFEIARKKALESKIPNNCLVLPIFVVIDKQLGGNGLSTAYIHALSYVLLGYIKCENNNDLEKMVKYNRMMDCCKRMVKLALGEEVDFDPLEVLTDDSTKDIVRCATDIDRKIHKEDPLTAMIEEALRKTLDDDNSDDREKSAEKPDTEQELFKESGDGSDLEDEVVAELIKDPGDGSDLEDEEDRIAGVTPIAYKDVEPTAMGELNALVGLSEVKGQIFTMLNVFKVRKRCEELDIKRPAISMHMIFTGNPGTGKTTVARILGKIYHEAGLLSKGHFVEASRTELVGKYVGHTAPLVTAVFEKAKGGILFIDEAYSLTSEGDNFGDEAVETLLKLMEDYRDDIVVVAAGYPRLMQEFLDSNPGLRSRFPFVVDFPDYSGDELTYIFKGFCKENDIKVSREVLHEVNTHFAHEVSKKARNYGNARAVRNYFEKMIMNQANRLVKSGTMEKADLCRFIRADLPKTIKIKPMQIPDQHKFTVV